MATIAISPFLSTMGSTIRVLDREVHSSRLIAVVMGIGGGILILTITIMMECVVISFLVRKKGQSQTASPQGHHKHMERLDSQQQQEGQIYRVMYCNIIAVYSVYS